ncbi:hypothetical protein HJFPF1_05428 [Paramyrothecium foliicola]|nr:hypothetical protein HJFPF1_05428 [Paramyrothecium foliicola]
MVVSAQPTDLPKSRALEKKSKLQALTDEALEKARSEELDPDLDLNFSPTKPSLEGIASAGHPFSLIWSREVRSILASLDIQRLKDPAGPWMLDTPFDTRLVQLLTVIPDSIREGSGGLSTSGHYRDGLSTTSESSTEHLSAALGVTVGYPFLNASVSAKYDRKVSEDKNGVKASRNASCRAGRVILDGTPVFSKEAIALLQSGKGAESRFRKRYGDYYVCGFVLGADAGACMSADTESKSSEETLEITVKVKVLFFEASATHTEVIKSQSQSSSISFSAYSTLENVQPLSLTISGRSTSPAADQQLLQRRAKEYLEKFKRLQQDVQAIMRESVSVCTTQGKKE